MNMTQEIVDEDIEETFLMTGFVAGDKRMNQLVMQHLEGRDLLNLSGKPEIL